MKRSWILTLSAILVAAAPILADKTTTTLLDARTTKGPSSAIYAAASPAGTAETGAEHWYFQFHPTGFIMMRLEMSLDGGAHWIPISGYVTGSSAEDILISQSACGACRLRVNVTESRPGGSVSVWVTQSGTLVPVVTPALMPTVKP